MGKREQFIRVLLRAATDMGWVPSGSNLEHALECAAAWVWKNQARCSVDGSAWLSIADTLACAAPKGGSSDEPPAASRTM